MMTRIPVTIITGFLGSGKTTLICNLLKQTPDRRLAVLVNEFGEVSVDGALLRSAGDGCRIEVHDLPNGCICCTVRDDFLPIMQALQERKHEVDHVLIETSGLALPAPVMRALSWPEIRNDFQLDAVLAVVDTPQLLAGRFENGTPIPGAEASEAPVHLASTDAILNQQLENADVAILNKIDDLSEDHLIQAEEMVRRKAGRLRFIELAYQAELDTRLCMGLNLHEEEGPANGHPPSHHHDHGHGHDDHHGPVQVTPVEGDAPLADQHQFDGHTHSGLSAHTHGEGTHEHFHAHDPGWQSFVLHSHQAQQPERLRDAVREVTAREPILRAKGFARVEGKPHRLVLQAVRNRVQAYFGKEHAADAESSVVFIGYHPSRERAIRLMRELTGSDWH
ncbi:MAG: GTP-binding protein [Verrucomicrobia bacterium]|nr:GTP-binding protein [Verrucomicrobiota bacterium]